METVRVPVDELELHPANARQGDVGAISESLRIHGQYRPIVVQTSTRYVLAGNHTLQAARALGWTEIDVVWLDVDDDEGLRILLVDNRTNDLATYDNPALASLLESLIGGTGALLGTGYDGTDLDLLLADIARGQEPLDPLAAWNAAGMPEFNQDTLGSKFRVTVHFGSDEDADAFFELIGRPRRTSMWWPAHDGHVGANTTTAAYVEG